MNKIFKYIIVQGGIPIIFGCDIMHDQVFKEEAVSAGFLVLKYETLLNSFSARCFGESKSLGMKSRLQIDAKVIEDFLNF